MIEYGQIFSHILHLLHFSLLMVTAPPNNSIALLGHSFKHGASDGGWQFIQNNGGMSTSSS